MTLADVSYAQEGVWLVDRLAGDLPVGNVSLNVRLCGPLDVDALRRAVAALPRRHAALRTAVVQVDGRPMQQIEDDVTPPWTYVDLATSTSAAEASARVVVERQARQRFAVDRAPLFRCTVVRVAPEEHILLITFHHLIIDAWSVELLLDDLDLLYRGGGNSAEGTSAARATYAAYAAHQRRLNNTVALAFWREALADPPPTSFPADRPRTAAVGYYGARHEFRLPQELGAAVPELAHRHRVTPFMTALAAFCVLLARYSGRNDLLVGIPVSGRDSPEWENVVGLIVDTLPVRVTLSEQDTFVDVLHRVRTAFLRAMSHRAPYEQITGTVVGGGGPLCRVVFSHNAARGTRRLGTASMVPQWQPDTGAVKFDLAVYLVEEQGDLRGVVEYRTALYDAATIGRMARGFGAVFAAAVATPDAAIVSLPLLAAAERAALLERSRSAAPALTGAEPDHTVVSAFRRQVNRAPDAVAVAGPGCALGYGELDRRCRALAARLTELGVGPDTVVGVCLPRTADLVVSILAVLQAGGAYLPLDPDYPARRLEFMAVDADVDVLLTTSPLAATLPVARGRRLVCLDAPCESALEPPGRPPAEVSPSSLAYVVYTSGSTGQPKGVRVAHAELLASTAARTELYGESPAVFLSLSSASFDSFVAGLYWTLCDGGTFVLADAADMREPRRIANLVESMRVTHTLLLPALYAACIDELTGRATTLRVVICAGEALGAHTVQRHYEVLPEVALYNEYGPTEATVWATGCRVGSAARPMPIGSPRAGAHVYVLDPRMELVPVGVPGELYIGGASLALGYHRRPGMTADRFRPDPFTAGARLYRTGDVARWLPDGNLEYLGRADDQIKVSGYRIEPGEVEAVLRKFPGVAEAAVSVEGEGDGAALVGYVVARGAAPVDVSRLTHFAAQRLPRHMVPARIDLLAALPLTPNGKVDRHAIGSARAGRQPPAVRSQPFVAPGDVVETVLAQAFADVLGRDAVGVDDSFFALGGTSLQAMGVAAAAAPAGVDVRVADVLATPTVRELARLVRARPDPPAAVPQGLPTGVALPLTPAQEGFWLEEQLSASPGGLNLACALLIEGPTDRERLAASWRAVVLDNQVLRLRFGVEAGRLRQRVLPASPVDVPLVESPPVGDLAEHLEGLRRQPLDLASGPVCAAYLVPLGPERVVFVLVVHHIVADVETQQALLQQVADRYDDPAAGGRTGPPSGAFAAYVAESNDRRDPSAQLAAFWRRLLQPSSSVLPSSAAHAGSTAAAWLRRAVGKRADAELDRIARRCSAPRSVAAAAVLARALGEASGRSRVTMGLPTTMRDRPAYRGAVGLFLETMVLPVDLPAPDAPFEEVVRAVHDRFRACYDNLVPFQSLVALAAPTRRGHDVGLVDTVFNYLGRPLAAPVLPGLRTSLVDFDVTHTVHPLAVYWENSDAGPVVHVGWQRDRLPRTWVTGLMDALTCVLDAAAATS